MFRKCVLDIMDYAGIDVFLIAGNENSDDISLRSGGVSCKERAASLLSDDEAFFLQKPQSHADGLTAYVIFRAELLLRRQLMNSILNVFLYHEFQTLRDPFVFYSHRILTFPDFMKNLPDLFPG